MSKSESKVKTVIGILSYNDKHYLEKVLPDICKLHDSKVIILDNAHNDEVKNFLNKKYPQINYLRHEKGNLGFGKGHNYIVKKSPPSDYYFCLNNDILIEKDGFDACVDHLDKNKDVCMVSSKLYHWDYDKNKKTEIIDTFGIIGNRGHHFWDRGQGKEDKGQYDETINKIFGVSGAAFFIRRSCISKLHGSDYKIFDENFFMYKEDIDLSYRMRWLDMKIDFLKNVLGYHARTLGKGQKKSFFLARMSYMNHLLLLRNNFSSKYKLKTKISVFVYEFAKFFFYLFTKPKVAVELFKVFRVKVNRSERKISSKKMEKYLL